MASLTEISKPQWHSCLKKSSLCYVIKAGHASQSDPLDRFYAKNLTLRIFEKGKVGTVRKFSDAIWFSKEDKWILKSASGKEFYFYSNEMKLVSVN